MGAQDNVEKVLRNMHVLLSKSEPVSDHPGKVLIDRQEVLDLLAELNTCIYAIMEEYEMTVRSRDKAEREFRKKGDDIIWDASRKAEDVYAASIMYTDEALSSLQEIMKDASEQMDAIYRGMAMKLEEEQKVVSHNQLELKSQLQDLRDTEKYLRLIEDRNEEILKEKRKSGKAAKTQEASIYANRQTEIKVNTEVLEKLGLSAELPEEDDSAESGGAKGDASSAKQSSATDSEELLPEDAELTEGKETFSNLEEAMASKGKEEKKKPGEGLGKRWKEFTSKIGG